MEQEFDEGHDLAGWFELSVEERVVELLGHVMLNLRDLPVFACDRSVLSRGATWFPAYVACVEAFFVNARLAAEFLVRMPNRDFNAKDIRPGVVASSRRCSEAQSCLADDLQAHRPLR